MGFNFLDNTQSKLTRALLILLALTFVIGFGYVGGIDLGGGTASGTAVEVNGEKVTYAQFKNLKDSLRRQFTQNQSDLAPQVLEFINMRALNNIVELKLLSQKARELGLRVSDEELAKTITSNPAFQIDGVFVGKENYESFITQRLNQTVGTFEESYKDELLARKFVSIINESAKVTDEELFNLYKIQNEEISLNYISFSTDNFIDSINPGEEEIKNYYNKNKNGFKTDERRKIEYIKITPQQFDESAKISQEEIKAYYEAYPEEFLEDGKVKPFDEVKTQIESELKTKKAKRIYDEFITGFSENNIESLEQFSTENSLGDIIRSDFFSQNEYQDLSKNLVNRAFIMEKGNVALISKNSSSWIVKVVDIQGNTEKKLSEVKQEIIKTLKKEKAKNAAKVSADETLRKINNSDKSFTNAAKSLGLKVNETAYFTRINGPSEIESKDIILESFQLSPEKPVLPKVYNSGEKFIIASLKEKRQVKTDEFEENKFSVKEREITRQRREILNNWIYKIRGEAKIVPNKDLFPPQG